MRGLAMRRARIVTAILGVGLTLPAPAHASHSITELYNPFYVVGIVLVVFLSFVIVALVVRQASRLQAWPTVRLGVVGVGRAGWLARVAVGVLRGAGVLGLLLVIGAGLFGHRIDAWNPAPLLVWVVAWVVIPAVQVFVGNVWAVGNPWLVLFEWAERLGGPMKPRAAYPAALGLWPALALFVVLTWFRVSSGVASEPRLIGGLVLAYSIVTWAGMAVFGKHVWLCRGECLTVFYSLLATAAPTEARVTDPATCRTCPLGCAAGSASDAGMSVTEDCVDCPECYARSGGGSINLRPWAVGLLGRRAAGLDTALFVLLMLATGMFGGLLETRTWEKTGVILGVRLAGTDRSRVADAAAFLAIVVLTMAVYWLACLAIRAAGGPSRSTRELAVAFAFSMIPLAAGFHLIHGVDHTVVDAQRLLRLLSDPFGLGWNVLGTRMWPVVPINPRLMWGVQLTVIVAVHVAGVYVAHVRALTLYRDRRAAIRSQFPMVAAIVLFTVSGLWILTRIPMIL